MALAGTLGLSGPQGPHLGPKERSRLPTTRDPIKPRHMDAGATPASNHTARDPEGTSQEGTQSPHRASNQTREVLLEAGTMPIPATASSLPARRKHHFQQRGRGRAARATARPPSKGTQRTALHCQNRFISRSLC